MSCKGILDPIHGWIHLSADQLKLIDLPLFQRLGYVKQLTSACYVFPGARHTRKEHCIGVMSIASKYGSHLFSDLPMDIRTRQIITLEIAGLFHDIGHGPYSHSWDATVYSKLYPKVHKGHDVHRLYILNKELAPYCQKMGINPNAVRDVWTGENYVLSAIVQGPLGSDRMDFIKRDTHNTGTQHFGTIDIDRVIYNSSIVNLVDLGLVLCYNSKIIPDIVQGLNSRLYMYRQVYFHKAVVAASVLIEAMIRSVVEPLKLVDRVKNLEEFKYLNDTFLMQEVLTSTDPKLEISRKYAIALYERKLPKMISETKIYVEDVRAGIEIVNSGEENFEDFKAIWRSRILVPDLVSEFEKYHIHVNEKGNIMPFREFWASCSDNLKSSEPPFYLERVYAYVK